MWAMSYRCSTIAFGIFPNDAFLLAKSAWYSKHSSVPSNVLYIKSLGKASQILETMSGENCQIFHILWFP